MMVMVAVVDAGRHEAGMGLQFPERWTLISGDFTEHVARLDSPALAESGARCMHVRAVHFANGFQRRLAMLGAAAGMAGHCVGDGPSRAP